MNWFLGTKLLLYDKENQCALTETWKYLCITQKQNVALHTWQHTMLTREPSFLLAVRPQWLLLLDFTSFGKLAIHGQVQTTALHIPDLRKRRHATQRNLVQVIQAISAFLQGLQAALLVKQDHSRFTTTVPCMCSTNKLASISASKNPLSSLMHWI